MTSELINELPPGAFATVTLSNGTTFHGEDDTRDDDRERGVLRMIHRTGDNNFTLFCCMQVDVVCFTMECEG